MGGLALPRGLPAALGHRSPALTLLVGLIDGLDFSIGPSGQDLDESLFICAGSLEGKAKRI